MEGGFGQLDLFSRRSKFVLVHYRIIKLSRFMKHGMDRMTLNAAIAVLLRGS